MHKVPAPSRRPIRAAVTTAFIGLMAVSIAAPAQTLAGVVNEVAPDVVEKLLFELLDVPQQRRATMPLVALRSDGGPACNLYGGDKTAQCLYDFLLTNGRISKTGILLSAQQQLKRAPDSLEEGRIVEAAQREMAALDAAYKRDIATQQLNGVDVLQRRVLVGSMLGARSVPDELAAMVDARKRAMFAANSEQAAYLFQTYSLLSRAMASGSRAFRDDAKALLLRLSYDTNITVNSSEGRQGWGIDLWLNSTYDPAPVLDLLVSDKTFAARYRGYLPKLLAFQALQSAEPTIALTAEQLIAIVAPDSAQDRGLASLSTALIYSPLIKPFYGDRHTFQSAIADRLLNSLDALEPAMKAKPSPFLSLASLSLIRLWTNSVYRGGSARDIEDVHRAWWKAAEGAQHNDWRYLALIAADLGATEKLRLAVNAMRHQAPFPIADESIWIYLARAGGAQSVIDALYAPTAPTRFTKSLETSSDRAILLMAAALTVTPSWSSGDRTAQRINLDACPVRAARLPTGPSSFASLKPQCKAGLKATNDAFDDARHAAWALRYETCAMLAENTRSQLFDKDEFDRLNASAVHAYGEVVARYTALGIAAISIPSTALFAAKDVALLLESGIEYADRYALAQKTISGWQRYPDAKLRRFREYVNRQQLANDGLKQSLTQAQAALKSLEMQGCL